MKSSASRGYLVVKMQVKNVGEGFNLSLYPEFLDGEMLLLMFTWKNTLISNSMVSAPNHALSGGDLCVKIHLKIVEHEF